MYPRPLRRARVDHRLRWEAVRRLQHPSIFLTTGSEAATTLSNPFIDPTTIAAPSISQNSRSVVGCVDTGTPSNPFIIPAINAAPNIAYHAASLVAWTPVINVPKDRSERCVFLGIRGSTNDDRTSHVGAVLAQHDLGSFDVTSSGHHVVDDNGWHSVNRRGIDVPEVGIDVIRSSASTPARWCRSNTPT